MDAETLLRAYDSQLRAEAEVSDAPEVTRLGPLWAATFPARRRGFVTYEPFGADVDLDALITEVVAHYEADPRVDRFEWKTRSHDQLPGLLDLLQRRGFVLEDVETVMAGDVASVIASDAVLPDGYRLERAEGEDALRAAEALAGRVFGDTPEESARHADALVARDRDQPGSFEMWLVRDAAGAVVCSGRVDFVEGTEFAGLWGGACDEAHRGRGLYRAITAARGRSAQNRGKRYVQSDCTPFSRPILERSGLVPITTTTPAIWRRP